jgi:hypothetical protein
VIGTLYICRPIIPFAHGLIPPERSVMKNNDAVISLKVGPQLAVKDKVIPKTKKKTKLRDL